MLVRPLEDAWQGALDAVLAAHGWPALDEPNRWGPIVAKLSASYNVAGTAARELLGARVAFSFGRDVPKGAAAVRELVMTGRLACPPDRPLRVLDLGAGLGATTWGVARALEAAGQRGEIDATWVDADASSLAAATEIARAASGAVAMGVRVRSTTVAAKAESAPRPRNPGEAHDVILVGQVLSELDQGAPAAARVAKHAALLRDLAERALRPDGSLVVIEPALRDRTRHLHAVRDAILSANATADRSIDVFAPCLHQSACPMLATENDWCHEDLPVDLPEWLAPMARAAGLRWQGLTFSYLVLRTDGATLADRGYPWRVVSGSLVSKGKRELFLCGATSPTEAARVRVQRLDRHEAPANSAWSSLGRGDRINVSPPPAPPLGRVSAETAVDVDAGRE